MTQSDDLPLYPHRHLLGIRGLSPHDIEDLLDRADAAVAISRQAEKKSAILRGRTQINLFFEASTRTQSSFELAGKRLVFLLRGDDHFRKADGLQKARRHPACKGVTR